MKNRKSRLVEGILIDVNDGTIKLKELDESAIDDFYEMLDCRCFDITKRKVGGKTFTFVLDDEGLLRDSPIPSAIDKDHNPMLVGNLFICRTAGTHLASLTDDDKKFILDNLVFGAYMINGKFRLLPAVGNVSYV